MQQGSYIYIQKKERNESSLSKYDGIAVKSIPWKYNNTLSIIIYKKVEYIKNVIIYNIPIYYSTYIIFNFLQVSIF